MFYLAYSNIKSKKYIPITSKQDHQTKGIALQYTATLQINYNNLKAHTLYIFART
jgi:hypothetical protein